MNGLWWHSSRQLGWLQQNLKMYSNFLKQKESKKRREDLCNSVQIFIIITILLRQPSSPWNQCQKIRMNNKRGREIAWKFDVNCIIILYPFYTNSATASLSLSLSLSTICLSSVEKKRDGCSPGILIHGLSCLLSFTSTHLWSTLLL